MPAAPSVVETAAHEELANTRPSTGVDDTASGATESRSPRCEIGSRPAGLASWGALQAADEPARARLARQINQLQL